MKTLRTFFLLVLTISTWHSAGIITEAAPFERWMGAEGSPQRFWYDTLIFAEAKFWLRRDQSRLYASTNGLDWDRQPLPFGFQGLGFGDGRFLAPTGNGTAVSSNGATWTEFPGSRPGEWRDSLFQPIAFGKGWFVSASYTALARPTVLYRTQDGAAWHPVHTIEDAGGNLISLAFADGLFLASASYRTNGTLEYVLLSSADAENWSTHKAPYFTSIASDGQVFVGFGPELITFALGSEFQIISRTPFQPGFGAVAYGNGRFVAVGEEIATSTNGVDWVRTFIPGIGPLHALAYGGGRFVAVGQNTFATSTNGLDWQTEGRAISAITGLEAVGGTVVATGTKVFGGGSAVIISTNRFEYNVHDVLPGTNIVTALAHANSQYIAAAGPKAYLSTNALEWREVDSGFLGTINAITYFDGRFWAAGSNQLGDGVVLQAAVGAPWEVSHTLPGRPLIDIEASSDRIIAVGGTNYAHGYVVASEDGTNWNLGQDLQFRPYSVSHFDGTFVIGGHFAGRAVSTNGIDWIQAADGQEIIKPIIKAGEWFTAVYQTGSGTMMLRSKDGVSWERRTFGDTQWGTSGIIERAVVAGSRFVISKGSLLSETEPLVPVLRRLSRSGSGLRLEVDRWANGPFGFEASDDLQNWSTVPGLNEANLEIEADGAWRFFRIDAR